MQKRRAGDDDGAAPALAVGDSVVVDIKGATLAKSAGALRLEGITAGQVRKVSSGNTVTARDINISTLLADVNAYDGTLVRITGGSITPHALYNLGNSRAEPLRDFIALIEAACGRKATLDSYPMQPGDMVETCADIADARRDLGFAPRVPLAEGVADFVRWYRNYTGR